MFKVKIWDKGNIMIFDGYTKTIPKAGQNFSAWTITKDKNGTVEKSEFNPARYRITYEEINGS
mgnify:FL=1|tara:strand:+ start:385 stop:573 length:189 start_codon:yes stop_codon:yes gene_type:complete